MVSRGKLKLMKVRPQVDGVCRTHHLYTACNTCHNINYCMFPIYTIIVFVLYIVEMCIYNNMYPVAKYRAYKMLLDFRKRGGGGGREG